jgi:hypothetical protein
MQGPCQPECVVDTNRGWQAFQAFAAVMLRVLAGVKSVEPSYPAKYDESQDQDSRIEGSADRDPSCG